MVIKTTLGDFICGRLADVGCYHVFGIPGDYALNIMNSMVAHPKLSLHNCLNELNVSYATEAYARVTGFGAMVVVMGVGELCTLNSLACANAEKIPMLLIVGTMPYTHVQKGIRSRHMTDPYDPHRGTRTTASCVEASVYVDSMQGIIDRIDNLFITSINSKRPVALHIPTDMQVEELWVPDGREHLKYSPQHPTCGLPLRAPLDNDQRKEVEYFATQALQLLRAAKSPVLVAGNQVVCYKLEDQVIRLAESLNAKVMHVPRLTGVIARDHPNFVPTAPLTTEAYDCVCQIGFDLCDMYTSMTQGRVPEIQFSVLCTKIGRASVTSVYYPDVLKRMQQMLDTEIGSSSQTKYDIAPVKTYSDKEMSQPITTNLVAEWAADNGMPDEVRVCCSGLTVWDMLAWPSRLQRPQYIQEFYATIGWALPATIGVMYGYASLQQKPTLSCWIGDGAFMMTAQDLAPLHEYSTQLGFIVRVFLLDNQGYLIERVIHENIYNDLPALDYKYLAEFAGCHYARVETLKDLEAAAHPDNAKVGTTLVHIVFDRFDCIDQVRAVGFGTKLCAQNRIPLERPTLPGFPCPATTVQSRKLSHKERLERLLICSI